MGVDEADKGLFKLTQMPKLRDFESHNAKYFTKVKRASPRLIFYTCRIYDLFV